MRWTGTRLEKMCLQELHGWEAREEVAPKLSNSFASLLPSFAAAVALKSLRNPAVVLNETNNYSKWSKLASLRGVQCLFL